MRKSDCEFPVFNGGPRACLGRRMAEVLGCWVIVRLASDFDFEAVGGNGMEEKVSQNSLTLPMKDGLGVRVRLRTKEQKT